MAGIFEIISAYHKKNKARSQSFEQFKACMAGAALTAMADGEFVRREDAALEKLAHVVGELKLFGSQHTREVFMGFLKDIQDDPVKGREKAMQAVAIAKDDPAWAATAVMLAATISEADGVVDDAELDVVNRLTEFLGIEPGTIEALEIDFRDEIFR